MIYGSLTVSFLTAKPIMKKVVLLMIRLYRLFVSPFLRQTFGYGCRFNPTCSAYALKVIEKHGLVKGLGLTCVRIVHCQPFSRKADNFQQ